LVEPSRGFSAPSQPGELLHLPHKAAGVVASCRAVFLAGELLHLPHKAAGVVNSHGDFRVIPRAGNPKQAKAAMLAALQKSKNLPEWQVDPVITPYSCSR
jgi:hypothetical protein